MTKDIRTVLFDLDGTLIDSERLILASYRHAMRRHLKRVPPEEEWLATIGQPLVVQMRMFAERPDQVDAMIATYVDHNLKHHDELVRPFPGVRGLLEAVRESGAPDMVLVDYHLANRVSGLEVMSRLDDELERSVPAIVITADRSPQLEDAARARGYRLLRKPIRPAALRALMTNTLKNLS